MLYEQQGQYELSIHAYQRALEVDGENLEAAQRLAFLLEKLNRDAEAAVLWDKIWTMRETQATTRRRRLR
jgi:tetratricopeptide (TPR) repeat protein